MTYGFLFTKTQSYCRAFGKPTRQPLLLSFTVKYMHYILIPNCSPPFFHSLSPALSLSFFILRISPSILFLYSRQTMQHRQTASNRRSPPKPRKTRRSRSVSTSPTFPSGSEIQTSGKCSAWVPAFFSRSHHLSSGVRVHLFTALEVMLAWHRAPAQMHRLIQNDTVKMHLILSVSSLLAWDKLRWRRFQNNISKASCF